MSYSFSNKVYNIIFKIINLGYCLSESCILIMRHRKKLQKKENQYNFKNKNRQYYTYTKTVLYMQSLIALRPKFDAFSKFCLPVGCFVGHETPANKPKYQLVSLSTHKIYLTIIKF